MSRLYEVMFIVRPDAAEEDVDKLIAGFTTSVTNALGSQEWLRLRIGVGPDLPPEAREIGGKRPGRDYLLSPMRKGDLAKLDEVLDRVATATRRIIQEGPGPAMNEFNRRE